MFMQYLEGRLIRHGGISYLATSVAARCWSARHWKLHPQGLADLRYWLVGGVLLRGVLQKATC